MSSSRRGEPPTCTPSVLSWSRTVAGRPEPARAGLVSWPRARSRSRSSSQREPKRSRPPAPACIPLTSSQFPEREPLKQPVASPRIGNVRDPCSTGIMTTTGFTVVKVPGRILVSKERGAVIDLKVTRRVDVETVETPSPPGATLDPAELRDVEGLVGSALDAMLAITRSPLGFIALVDQGGELRLTERSAGDAGGLNGDSIRTIARSVMDGEPARSETSTFMGVPIELAGSVIGMLGVANASAYTPAERQALRIFADHIATAVELARLRHSRRALVETLVNARAELERSEEKRAVAEERARSAERLENAHRLAVQALTEVSANLRVSEGLPEFYRRLTASVAGLVGARRCLFWQVNREGMLEAIPGAYGVDDDFVSRLYPAPCDPEGTDLTSQVVYKDLIFRAATADKKQSERDRAVLSTLQVRNAISVPWRAGEHRLGVIAVYDSERADAFSREDAWVLQIVGLAA